MCLASLIFVALAAPTAEPDPNALVNQLGAPRYAVREAATRALESRGVVALAALRAAQDAKDPEVRTRAEALVEKIESDMMVKPTLVKLDYENRPLVEVVKSLAERCHVSLTLQPENAPMWQGKRVTLKAEEPVPFWEAIDRLCLAAEVQTTPGAPMMGPGGRGAGLVLSHGPGWSPGPKSDNGPFRTHLSSLHYHKDLNLGRQGQPGFLMPNNLPVQGLANRSASEQFYFQVQVQAEPRLMLSQSGAPTILEALDEKGQSLLMPPANGNAVFRNNVVYGGNGAGFGMTTLQSTGFLKRPEQPGKLIKSLKGKIPVTVSARKDDPIVISLKDAKDKEKGKGVIEVNEVKADAPNQRTTIDLTIRPNSGDERPEGMMMRQQTLPQSQIEILDAQGRVYPQWFPFEQSASPSEIRMKIMLMANEGVGPPAKLRYYDLVRANTEAVFEFHDLPMP